MKWLSVLIAGSVCGAVQAAPGLLVPVVTPVPVYPQALLEARHPGKVRALLTVKSDGSVSEAKAIESAHPQMAASVEQTLAQWRFKPWIGTLGAPPLIAVTVPVIFGSPDLHRFDKRVSMGLGNVPCAYLNHEAAMHSADFPDMPLNQVDVFWYTGQFLHSHYAALQLGEHGPQALLGQLETSIPAIIDSCQRNPQRRYGDFLPAPIKALLVEVVELPEPQEAS